MTLAELMSGYTPDATFAGVATNDDFVLAVDVSDGASAADGEYVVAQSGISAVDAQLSAESDEKTYIRQGKVTTKTATQRTFNLGGDRMHGDPFQDFVLSHAIKFGVGAKVIRPYIYFSLQTGVGERGFASIIVNSDGSGDAGASAEIDIDIMTTAAPAEYTWASGTTGEETNTEDEVGV